MKSNDTKVVDLDVERPKRIHDLHERRLQRLRQAFEQAIPMKNTDRTKTKKKRNKR